MLVIYKERESALPVRKDCGILLLGAIVARPRCVLLCVSLSGLDGETMDVYYAVCRFWCCCPGNDDPAQHPAEWRINSGSQSKKDIDYVLHHGQDIAAGTATTATSAQQLSTPTCHANNAATPTSSAK